ncbi:hypothetical protein BVRB_8g192410 [Beta vulgaris subsp. vulgaris]|nr:hypothetical protein BVRB_8g192410 [Beta vulgaris subsp. vulgaris]
MGWSLLSLNKQNTKTEFINELGAIMKPIAAASFCNTPPIRDVRQRKDLGTTSQRRQLSLLQSYCANVARYVKDQRSVQTLCILVHY